MDRCKHFFAAVSSRTLIVVGLTMCMTALCFTQPAEAAPGLYLTGWWTNIEHPERLSGYANSGSKLVLANYAGWYYTSGQYPTVQTYLDTAQALGIQVILGMTRTYATPYDISAADYTAFVNHFKGHPALYGWYIADEPELQSVAYGYLSTDPGYFALTKQADPNHPVLIAHSGAPSDQFANVEDLTGVDWYPKQASFPEFGGPYMPFCYDTWRNDLNWVAAHSKQGAVAVAQGFGTNPWEPVYGDLTYSEMRYQVFSAVVQGVSRILFWSDDYALQSTVMPALTNRAISQIQAIAPQMMAGLTNDPSVAVNQTTANLTYRYGVSGGTGVLLAVNIANRVQNGGTALLNVQFTLPGGVRPTQVEVVDENRTIPVVQGTVIDNFDRFAVHIYRWSSTATSTAPIITNLSSSGITDSAATITWTTDLISDSQVDYGTTTAYGTSSPLNTALSTTHMTSLGGLSPSTLYHYRVKSRDSAGNLATSADATFTTAAPPAQPLTITNIGTSGITNTGAMITWATNVNSDSQVEYGTSTAYGSSSALNATLSTSHTVSLGGLTPGTQYHFRVRSRDSAGNLSVSADATFTTNAATTGGAAPVITGVLVSASANSATVQWTTDHASDSQIEYGLTSAYGTVSAYNGAMTTTHSVVVSGLRKGTVYHYRIRTRDASANLSFSPDSSFMTNGRTR